VVNVVTKGCIIRGEFFTGKGHYNVTPSSPKHCSRAVMLLPWTSLQGLE